MNEEPVFWAFDLGKGSIGEAVRQGTKFLHKAWLLITAELAENKKGAAKAPVQELRLMASLSTAPSGSQLQLAFTYDYMGRRIQKIVSTNSSGSYIGEYTNKYAYDGWNCLAILNPSLTLSNSFLWGSDLSGTLQGAGGVGGLIKVSFYGATITNCFVAFDGNGNVSALINASNGVTVANYDYGPFGEVIRATGPMAKLNPAREGTKFYDDETDLVYYGYRYYNPSTGRWLSRDPIGEQGGLNLYAFVQNDAIDGIDVYGLASALTYYSDGEAYVNGGWALRSLGPTYYGNADDSGPQNTPNAYFLENVVEMNGNTGGVCDSGDAPSHNNSSFVVAYVTNTANCTTKVKCTCTVWYKAATAVLFTPTINSSGVGGFFVYGHVLSASLARHAPSVYVASMSAWWSSGWASVSDSQTFSLGPRAGKELYEGNIGIAIPGNVPGSDFHAEMHGACSCSTQ